MFSPQKNLKAIVSFISFGLLSAVAIGLLAIWRDDLAVLSALLGTAAGDTASLGPSWQARTLHRLPTGLDTDSRLAGAAVLRRSGAARSDCRGVPVSSVAREF
jgi:hypothetical protein